MILTETITQASACVHSGDYSLARQYTDAAKNVISELRSDEVLNNRLKALAHRIDATIRAIRNVNGDLPFRNVSVEELDSAAAVFTTLCSNEYENLDVAYEMIDSVTDSIRNLASGRYDLYPDAKQDIVETVVMTLDEVATLVPSINVTGVQELSHA